MISESASEQSNMSPSPPATKSTKHNATSGAHHKTNLDRNELNEHQSRSKKFDYLSTTNAAAAVAVATTQSASKKKSKSKQHNVTKHIDDEDDDDIKMEEDRVRKRHSNSSECNNRQSGARNELNTKADNSKSNHSSSRVEYTKHEKASKDVEIINSHKSKCPNTGTDCNTSTTTTTYSNAANNPLKKIKKEKKRYQEMVIDGFTITAFRTWEDLQDEMNERISANIKKNAAQNAIDSEMPNTSCNSANSFPTATEAIPQTNNQADNATASTPQPKQSSSKIATVPTCATLLEPNRSSPRESARLDHFNDEILERNHSVERGGTYHVQEDRKDLSRADKRREQLDNSSLLHKSLRRGEDRHELEIQNHDKSQHRQEYHKNIRLQSTRDTSVSEARQHHTIPSVNSNYPYGSESIHEQYRSNRLNDVDLKRSTRAQFDPQRAPFSGPTMITPNSYPKRSPSPPPPLPPHLPSTAQTAQQYFQQYHQLYKQMHNSAQQLHQPPHHAPPPQPHLQNPYLALMNFPNSAHLKGPGPPQLPPLPPPPPPAMPMPNPGAMIGASPFNSPYTITDTIISRQTSIIPSGALPPMPSGLEHITGSRYTRQQHLSALEQSMGTQPGFGQLPNPSSYMPSPTERSFMEFARSYANASNMSSGYGSFINHPSIPKNTMGTPNFYGHLERMTMDHQQRSVLQGFSASGSNPFSGFNPAGRPPISMFPPHYYP